MGRILRPTGMRKYRPFMGPGGEFLSIAGGGSPGGEAYQAVITTLDPDFWFQHEDGALGTNSSATAGANDGTVTGVTATTGYEGGGGAYDGSSDIAVPTYSGIDNASQAGKHFSFMGWVYLDSTSGLYGCIVSKGPSTASGTGNGWVIYERLNELAFFSPSGSNWEWFYSTGTSLPDDTWVHLAMSVYLGNNTQKIWVNGVGVGVSNQSTMSGANQDDSGFDPWIGKPRAVSSLSQWKGTLDEICLWKDYALTNTDVMAAWDARTGAVAATSSSDDFESYSTGAFSFTNWTHDRDRATFTIVTGQELNAVTNGVAGADIITLDAAGTSESEGVIDVEVTPTNTGSTNIQSGPVGRWVDIDNCIFGGLRLSLGGLYITTRDAAVQTSTTGSYAFVANTKYYLRCTFSGVTIQMEAYSDAARTTLLERITHTTTHLDAGGWGLTHNGDPTAVAKFDDFTFTPIT